jgi:hypothetical protein
MPNLEKKCITELRRMLKETDQMYLDLELKYTQAIKVLEIIAEGTVTCEGNGIRSERNYARLFLKELSLK